MIQVIHEGWATHCSHLFCAEHARSWFEANNTSDDNNNNNNISTTNNNNNNNNN